MQTKEASLVNYKIKCIVQLALLFFICSIVIAQELKHKQIALLNKSDFEKTINGQEVKLFTLKNKNGTIAQITNYGGKVVSLWVKDKNDIYDDVVLGYDNIEGFLTGNNSYFGALVGRYANRIADGKFVLNGKEFKLAQNNGKNHLHGGNVGFDSVVWTAKQIDNQTLELEYLSKHMEEGYPGNLKVKVVYKLTDKNELKTEYWAVTDQPTIVNLTQHTYFNLKGEGNGTINDHELQINASYYTPVDDGLIPLGIIATVENTPFDFRALKRIGEDINSGHEQLNYGFGYDHNFVLNQNLEGLNYAAKVVDPISGRVLEVFTNEPGIQFYGGNFLDGSVKGKSGKNYIKRSGLNLETQHFPDSPNKPHFPSTRLNPGEEYYSICIYKFSITK